MKNRFKELEEEAVRNAPPPPRAVEDKIISQLGNYRTWTSIVDHFVSAPIQLIRKMMETDLKREQPDDKNPPNLGQGGE